MRICKRMGCCFLGCLPFRRIHPSPGHRSAGRTGWCPHHSSCGPLSTPPPPLHTCNHVLGSRSKCQYPANLSLAASRRAAVCLVGWLVGQRASRHYIIERVLVQLCTCVSAHCTHRHWPAMHWYPGVQHSALLSQPYALSGMHCSNREVQEVSTGERQ